MKKTDLKTKRIQLRLTEKEKKELEAKAKKENCTISKYILKKLQQNPHITSKSIQNKDSIYHLSRIGNNLNQISYNLNKLYKSKKIDNSILKDISEELMFMNLQISTLLTKK